MKLLIIDYSLRIAYFSSTAKLPFQEISYPGISRSPADDGDEDNPFGHFSEKSKKIKSTISNLYDSKQEKQFIVEYHQNI